MELDKFLCVYCSNNEYQHCICALLFGQVILCCERRFARMESVGKVLMHQRHHFLHLLAGVYHTGVMFCWSDKGSWRLGPSTCRRWNYGMFRRSFGVISHFCVHVYKADHRFTPYFADNEGFSHMLRDGFLCNCSSIRLSAY